MCAATPGAGMRKMMGIPNPTPTSTPIPASQQNLAATPNGAGDSPQPKIGGRRSRENAQYADKANPNLRRGDGGGITM